MASKEGGERIEWIGAAKGKTSEKFWVYWKRPEEWASAVEAWVSCSIIVITDGKLLMRV